MVKLKDLVIRVMFFQVACSKAYTYTGTWLYMCQICIIYILLLLYLLLLISYYYYYYNFIIIIMNVDDGIGAI